MGYLFDCLAAFRCELAGRISEVRRTFLPPGRFGFNRPRVDNEQDGKGQQLRGQTTLESACRFTFAHSERTGVRMAQSFCCDKWLQASRLIFEIDCKDWVSQDAHLSLYYRSRLLGKSSDFFGSTVGDPLRMHVCFVRFVMTELLRGIQPTITNSLFQIVVIDEQLVGASQLRITLLRLRRDEVHLSERLCVFVKQSLSHITD